MEWKNKLFVWLRSRNGKRGLIILALLLIFAIFSGLSSFTPKEEIIETVKPVKILEAKEEQTPFSLEYLGVVNPHTLKKIGFEIPGKIAEVTAEKGRYIKSGEVLAKLDTTDLALAAQAAKNIADNMLIAYEFARDNYEKTLKLQEAGALSEHETDKARIEMENLQASYKNAVLDYQNKLNTVDKAILRSDMDGYIADVFNKEGEIIQAGYPLAMIRGEKLEVNVGVSQTDLPKIKAGIPARIEAGEVELTGKVTSIGQIPEARTSTYMTTVEIQDTSLPLGRTVTVFFDLGEEKGIYVPIKAIINDGEDIVYIVDNELIVRKKRVQLGRIKNSTVLVAGVNEGDRIVVEGMKNLRDGDRVSLQ